MRLYQLNKQNKPEQVRSTKEERQDRRLLLVLAKVAPGKFEKETLQSGNIRYATKGGDTDPTIEYWPIFGTVKTLFGGSKLANEVEEVLNQHGYKVKKKLTDIDLTEYTFKPIFPSDQELKELDR